MSKSVFLLYDVDMSKKPQTQKTPKEHEIPVPTREEFESNLKKVAKPNKSVPHNPKE